MRKIYLIDMETSLAVWCGDVIPILTSSQAKCGDDLFLCYNENNSAAFEADEVADFLQNKFKVTDGSIILSPDWVEPIRILTKNEVEEFIVKIDVDVDAIYAAAIGNRTTEYTEAEVEALAYKEAGYTGVVPDSVTSWANPKKWTPTQAADDILSKATQWRSAAKAIRASRLNQKELAREAFDSLDVNGFETAVAQWNGFVVYIRGILKI